MSRKEYFEHYDRLAPRIKRFHEYIWSKYNFKMVHERIIRKEINDCLNITTDKEQLRYYHILIERNVITRLSEWVRINAPN